MRWARIALCTLSVATLALLGTSGAGAPGADAATAPVAARSAGPALTLVSQTPWVTAQQPWFNIALGVSASAGAASGLHVSLTFYGRLDDSSELQQSISGTPSTGTLGRVNPVAVTAGGPTGLTASTCVTVLPRSSSSVPTQGSGACPAGNGNTLTLGCTPNIGHCGDVYPVGVALFRQGSSTPVAHFTTFLTYQEPSAVGPGGALAVALV